MKTLRVWWLVIPGVVSGWQPVAAEPHAFAAPLLAELEHCIMRTERRYRNDDDYDFIIRRHCPKLSRLLVQRDFAALLQQPLPEEITLDLLRDLQSIGTSVQATPDNAMVFDLGSVRKILDDTVMPESAPQKSWWRRFLDWLAESFDHGTAQPPDWLKHWLSRFAVPDWLVATLYKGTVGLLAILLLGVVVTELRAARWRRWFDWRARRLRLHARQSDMAREVILTWEAIAQLPPGQQLLACYGKVLHILAARNLLPSDASLTNHELQSLLEMALGGAQPVFRQLLAHVDGLVYGEQHMDAATVGCVTRDCRKFADSLVTN